MGSWMNKVNGCIYTSDEGRGVTSVCASKIYRGDDRNIDRK